MERILTAHKQRQHFDLCSDKVILLFVSLAYNAAKGNLNLTQKERESLKPYKKFVCELGYCKSTIADKRRLLNKNCKMSLQTINTLYKAALDRIATKSLK